MKLKVACLNLWFGGKLFDAIQAFVEEENPDIMGLQEVYQTECFPPKEPWHAVKSLAEQLGYEYYAFAPAFAEEVESGYRVQMGNAIISRYPINSSSTIFYDVPYDGRYIPTPGDYQFTPRNLQHGEIVINEKIVHVFNTQGIWGFDGDDNERRLRMGESIARETTGKHPAILMGDFNIQEGSKTTDSIQTHMRSVFQGEMKTSFNMKYKENPGYALAVVDMMFVSPDVKIGTHYVSRANVSDHLALVANFEMF